MSEILTTERLRIRELAPDDLDFVAEMLAHPEVMRHWPRPMTREEAVAWIDKQRARYQTERHGYWLALDRATGRPVGQAGLMFMDLTIGRLPALGYILHRPYWRRGLALEAAAACLDYGFAHFDYPRIIAAIRPVNLPSLRVAHRLGMMPTDMVEYAGFDHLIYSLDRPDRSEPRP
jgi:RimJ/RimL family protein N-acetyltransferase